jgi:3-dehydroquinate synthase
VRIKAEVVSSDERETGPRRILNFGHTFGHALEAETKYTQFLHGEAVSWGMRAATFLARDLGMIGQPELKEIIGVLDSYGPIPSLAGVAPEALQARLVRDKKTIQSRVHFVLPIAIGEVVVRADIDAAAVGAAIRRAQAECR